MGWIWLYPSLWPWSWKFVPSILQWVFTEEHSITLVSQFLSEPCINPAHVLAFLCQAHDWVLKFQILGTAVAWTPTFPTRECLTMLLIFVEPLLAKQLHNPTAVLSLWQQSKKLAPRLTVTSHLPCSYSWEQCSI